MKTFSRSKKSTAGSVTSPWTSSRMPSCAGAGTRPGEQRELGTPSATVAVLALHALETLLTQPDAQSVCAFYGADATLFTAVKTVDSARHAKCGRCNLLAHAGLCLCTLIDADWH